MLTSCFQCVQPLLQQSMICGEIKLPPITAPHIGVLGQGTAMSFLETY